MPKHIWSETIRTDAGGTVAASSTTVEDDSEENFAGIATAGNTLEIDLPVDVSQLKSFYIYSDQDVTFNTEDNISPVYTYPLLAKKTLSWRTGTLATNPLLVGGDVTKLYFKNLGADDANVKGGFLLNLSTP